MKDRQSILRKNLRYLRCKNYITQEEMAKFLGINSKSTISALENGEKLAKVIEI